MTEFTFTSIAKAAGKDRKMTSKVIIAIAHDDGQVLLCEESVALEFVQEAGCGASIDGFFPRACEVGIASCSEPGIYVGELHIVDDGPAYWEMPDIHDYYAEIRDLRPITKEEWHAHLTGEWPEGFELPISTANENPS